MAEWNIQFGKTALVVVTVTLLATAGSLFYIYHYDDGRAIPPQFVDPFDRPDLTAEQQKFFHAVNRGDVREVRRMLQEDKSLAKASVENVGTPLHIAATRDMVDVARALLDAGADIEATGQWGGTPLHWAAWLGRVDMLHLLIERGANVERRCASFDATPLLWASYGSGNAQRWQYNRFAQGSTRAEAREDRTPDEWEAERARRRSLRETDYAECVLALIDAGADVNTRNREGVPAIALALPSVASILLRHGAVNDYVPPPPATEPSEPETPDEPRPGPDLTASPSPARVDWPHSRALPYTPRPDANETPDDRRTGRIDHRHTPAPDRLGPTVRQLQPRRA